MLGFVRLISYHRLGIYTLQHMEFDWLKCNGGVVMCLQNNISAAL